jgi:glycosyltransferase involved in cell wall biosynthesis
MPDGRADATNSPVNESGAVIRARAAADAVRGVRADPIVVITYPGFTLNPYGRLMESGYAPHGFAAVHVTSPEEVDAIVDDHRCGRYRAFLHLNTFHALLRCNADAPPQLAASRSLARLDGWLTRDVPLVVSVHNGPQVSGQLAAAERTVAQGIAERARLIHLLTRSTPEQLSGWIKLDRHRCAVVPHPNYDGAYPRPAPAREARARIGLDPIPAVDGGDEIVVGMVGSQGRRKGLPVVLDAFARVGNSLPDGRVLRLVLAGAPLGPDAACLLTAAAKMPQVTVLPERLTDQQFADAVAALDVAVVPYRTLNSGWLHAALTFGLPVVAPSSPNIDELVPRTARLCYDEGTGSPTVSAAGLAAQLLRAGSLATSAARATARAAVASKTPNEMSNRFVTEVLEVVARDC